MTEESFFERINEIKERLYKIAYSYTYSESLAIDTVDEIVFQAYIKRKQLKNEQFLKTWITRILINYCNRQYKKNKKMTYIDEGNMEEAANMLDQLPLKLAISKLPRNLQSVIVLNFFSGYTLAEIAIILKKPQGTIASWQRKALKLLRLEMEVYDE